MGRRRVWVPGERRRLCLLDLRVGLMMLAQPVVNTTRTSKGSGIMEPNLFCGCMEMIQKFSYEYCKPTLSCQK
jgi:hypothetical protein